ncbi:hypothetical protein KP509_13G020000 [Ceratopteris richardii]|uniref:Auxin-responsive protein n=1 Tax=Ceratopteris richardii TaxID=49495 RepID=A0A8T2TDU1_CERRI|nr:hypothetical protein KP509_13G020000 [Ceratopteris richardii]
MGDGNGFLSLVTPKNVSFCSSTTAWDGTIPCTEANASSGNFLMKDIAKVEEKESMSGLKEHDYIGLAEVSSSAFSLAEASREDDHTLNETELDLGLGLGLCSASIKKSDEGENTPVLVRKQNDGAIKLFKEGSMCVGMEVGKLSLPESSTSLHKSWQLVGSVRSVAAETFNAGGLIGGRDLENISKSSIYSQDIGDGAFRANGSSSFLGGYMKNGTKRGYTEAMNEVARFNLTNETRAGVPLMAKAVEGETTVFSQHPQGALVSNWAPSKPSMPSKWPVGIEQPKSHSLVNNKLGAEKLVVNHDKPSNDRKEPSTSEPPPKGQVVGWPPIRSYRKHNLAKPAEMYVKVNMDGMTVGRKVDLNAHSSYEGLLLALEDMFQPSNTGGQGTSQGVPGRDSHANDGKQFRLLNGSDYVLTYEDQDGDWMLVGDVPWSMFVTMVRRLRITRGSEATGLVPKPDKTK